MTLRPGGAPEQLRRFKVLKMNKGIIPKSILNLGCATRFNSRLLYVFKLVQNKGKPGKNRPEPAKKLMMHVQSATNSGCVSGSAPALGCSSTRPRVEHFQTFATRRHESHARRVCSLYTLRAPLRTVAHHCQPFPTKKILPKHVRAIRIYWENPSRDCGISVHPRLKKRAIRFNAAVELEPYLGYSVIL